MDLYGDSFKLQDMIDSDMRSLRSELGDYFSNDISCSPGASHLESLNPGIGMDALDSTLDSELSNDGGSGWMDNSQLFNLSADFDSIGGLLVNPQTALPVSMSEPLILSSSLPSSSSDSSSLTLASENQDSSAHTTSNSITVTLPIQIVSATSLTPEMSDAQSQVNLTVSVPTPSPSPHSITSSQAQQIFAAQESETNCESNESPKPKSKNKNVKSTQQMNIENAYPKPAYSYSCLIAMALKNSKNGSLPVHEIYDFMTENFPYFKTAPNGWKNSVRHNLSLNKCFEKIEKPTGNSAQRKGYLWAMNPAKIEKMEEELQKWGSKDPVAIRKSMANPERLELIEKGELKNNESEVKTEDMSISDEECEIKEIKQEKEDEDVKPHINTLGNDLLNHDFPSLGDSVNMDSCLPELDLQKGIWENLCEDRLHFMSDSPINPLSPKNSETMDDDSSLESAPSSQRSYIQANYIYKCAQRASSSDASAKRLLAHPSLAGTEQGTTCDA
ncbi:forkhead box protein C2-B-like [Uloborus diversus]|uniref:forkhead box protein C2-B-like n=1 Tax=Uloborus diversus TaxID=327109 RepID=UPI00240A68EC|nr:forkhead box protein C2-B-like [Uloborus diversus]